MRYPPSGIPMGLREGVTDGQLGDYTWRAMSYTWWVRGVTRGELDEVPPFGRFTLSMGFGRGSYTCQLGDVHHQAPPPPPLRRRSEGVTRGR